MLPLPVAFDTQAFVYFFTFVLLFTFFFHTLCFSEKWKQEKFENDGVIISKETKKIIEKLFSLSL